MNELVRPHTNLIGQLLINKGLITSKELELALDRQNIIGEKLGRILVCLGYISLLELEESLSVLFNLPFNHLVPSDFDKNIISAELQLEYLNQRYLPLKKSDSKITLIIADPDRDQIKFLKEKYSNYTVNFSIVFSPEFYVHYHTIFSDTLSEHAVNALSLSAPEYSAKTVITSAQKIVLGALFLITLFFLIRDHISAIIVLNTLAILFLTLNFIFKFTLIWLGTRPRSDFKIGKEDFLKLPPVLPIYSIIIPLYKEAESASFIVNSIKKIDYPLEKLDIKIVLEADDFETISIFKKMQLPPSFDIIVVPHSLPKTKPKACNYALHFIKGQFVTIYDAEDRPDPLQLKKALITFSKSDGKTACVQAKLNYFNSNENWLSKMFTLEYSMWFDFFLPALEELNVPIPLGGTSNHFKVDILKSMGGWDPFNVTEDADLGIRFSELGLRVEIINSTTYEEANISVINWIKQRSRWQKGYMQTYLVHMRSPLRFIKKMNLKGFLSFQLFIGSTFISALIMPWMYFIFLCWIITATDIFHIYFPPVILALGAINLIFGNFYFIYIHMLGVFKRKNYQLIPYAIAAPIYWFLMSLAAYRGLWQLISNPFYWDKTKHGLSKVQHE